MSIDFAFKYTQLYLYNLMPKANYSMTLISHLETESICELQILSNLQIVTTILCMIIFQSSFELIDIHQKLVSLPSKGIEHYYQILTEEKLYRNGNRVNLILIHILVLASCPV